MSTQAESRPTAISLLQSAAFVATFDRFAMSPMLVAIAHDLDAPLGSVVRAAGAYFLVYGVSQPVWGIVSDRFGRVATMRMTLLLAGICSIVSAGSGTALVLGVTRGLAGGMFGAAYPAALIYLGDTVRADVRQRDVARLMVGTALGTALASVGAGVVADVASWRVMFVLTGLAALALAARLGALPEPERVHHGGTFLRPMGYVGRSPVTLFVLLCALAEGAVLLGTITLLPPAMENAGASTTVAGLATGVYGVSVFACSALVARLSQRWRATTLITMGAAAAIVACAVLAVSQSVAAGVATAILLGLAWTAMHSTLQTWATEVLPIARATVVSFFAGSLFVGSSLAAVIAAGLADEGRYGVLFAAGAALAVPLGLAATAVRARWHAAGPTPLRP
ncbi:MAG TPA: MFS transporter [Nocardioides sp.]|uniref:MFS transporter n=1 Tax=Nocardioides sp. TaxID=35761 RepID=UPI002F423AFD